MIGKFKFGSPFIVLNIESNDIEVMLDTGFNGEVILPEKIIKKLNLKQIGFSDYITASGEVRLTKVHIAKIKFFDEEKEAAVLSTLADISLAGMELFHECKIAIERHKDFLEVTKSAKP